LIPKGCKRLAEVDFPIAAVSKYAVMEKSIRQGHPSTLHLWWARRPLASSRSVLLSLLWPDPCDPLCPEDFKVKVRDMLPRVQGRVGPSDGDLRAALLKFIGDFANWDLAQNAAYVEVGRALVAAAYPDEPPLVVDPFSGGGSIPLEAMRVGGDAFASDLNPVAGLILRVMLEDTPKRGLALAEDLRRTGAELKAAAVAELYACYPSDPDGARPIAYLWARTVRCETSECGAEIPLVRSFWLSRNASRRRALRIVIERAPGSAPRVEIEIFEPSSGAKVSTRTVSGANATCPACRTVLPAERVRMQLAAQHGGADVEFDSAGRRRGGARLLAVALLRPGDRGRQYRLAANRDYDAVRLAQNRVHELLEDWKRPGHELIRPIPDELLPPVGTLGFRVQRYGMLEWGDLFTARQKLTLAVLTRLVRERADVLPSVRNALAMVPSKLANRSDSCVNWSALVECPTDHLKGNSLPMVWDFAESNLLSDSSASITQTVENIARNLEATVIPRSRPASVQVADAAHHPLPDDSADIWFTDPPYYDAVPYADLSDFFLVWLKRAMPNDPMLRDPFDIDNPLSPKRQEAVQDEAKHDNGRVKDRLWFEETMAKAFAEGRRVLRDGGVGSVVFAHKTTEGWEALLSGMIRGGLTITGSWPIATERYSRLRARDSAALATSVHLVCRPRPSAAPVGDWAEVLRELPRRTSDWMRRLQSEGVRGADLVFACIGPALEIFSRYSRVETAEGSEVRLAHYLEKVWEAVGRAALTQVLGVDDGGASTLEEDARLTALFLWTLQSTNGADISTATAVTRAGDIGEDGAERGDDEDATDDDAPASRRTRGYSLVYDVVRRFAQPLGVRLEDWQGRVIEITKGSVRLLPVTERAGALLGSAAAQGTNLMLDGTPSAQLALFEPESVPVAARNPPTVDVGPAKRPGRRDATTLDRVHLAMLLQRSGQAAALRSLLATEQGRGPEFLRLANALSALYPRDSEEKRLLDAMLLAVPR
jgi:adenine-specific DNA methylase